MTLFLVALSAVVSVRALRAFNVVSRDSGITYEIAVGGLAAAIFWIAREVSG